MMKLDLLTSKTQIKICIDWEAISFDFKQSYDILGADLAIMQNF